MDIKIEVQWTRAEIEKLLERDLNEKGFAPYLESEEKGPYFAWSGAPFEGTSLPKLQVKIQARVNGVLCPTTPTTSYLSTYTGPDGKVQVQEIPATGPTYVPSPQRIGPPASKRLLSPEEVEALAQLLPDPQYAEAILNNEPRNMFPGESKERPD